jgi:hypothetical protein
MVLTEAAGAAAGAEGTAVAAPGPDADAETFLFAGLSACDAVAVGCSCWVVFFTASASSMPVITVQLVHTQHANGKSLTEGVVCCLYVSRQSVSCTSCRK